MNLDPKIKERISELKQKYINFAPEERMWQPAIIPTIKYSKDDTSDSTLVHEFIQQKYFPCETELPNELDEIDNLDEILRPLTRSPKHPTSH